MLSQSSSVANSLTNDIWHHFLNELKIRQLQKLIPQYNQNYVSKIAGAGTNTAYLGHPPMRKILAYNQLNQDQFPPNIPIDQFANYVVKSIKQDNVAPTFKQKSPQVNSKQSYRYKRTGASFRATATSKQNKQDSQQLLSKYFVKPPPNDKQAQQLPINKLSQQEIDLQYQLRAIQKKLYYARQSKKQEQQKQKQRLLALKRKKSPQMPRTDFTYEYNGNFMRRKVVRNDSLLADEMKVSQSFDLHHKNKKNLQQLLQEVDPNRGRSQIGSRYQKANVFNNANKRQVSHLPFIKMTDNSNLREQNKNSQGNKTQRISLKSFSESLQQKGFKHHSELQKEKKDKQLLAKLQAQRMLNLQEQLDKNPQQPDDDGYNNLIKRRQSYLMSKYMRKLKQQQGEQTKKSLNFNRVSFPKNSAIHNYYKHDFNEERKFYESEVISRVLDNVGSVGNIQTQR